MLKRYAPLAQLDRASGYGPEGLYELAELTDYVCFVCAPLAQLDRASGYGPEGREFESLTAYQNP